MKHSENPEKEKTQKETRKDTMAKDSVLVELTEEKVMSLLKDTYMVIKNFGPLSSLSACNTKNRIPSRDGQLVKRPHAKYFWNQTCGFPVLCLVIW